MLNKIYLFLSTEGSWNRYFDSRDLLQKLQAKRKQQTKHGDGEISVFSYEECRFLCKLPQFFFAILIMGRYTHALIAAAITAIYTAYFRFMRFRVARWTYACVQFSLSKTRLCRFHEMLPFPIRYLHSVQYNFQYFSFDPTSFAYIS
jgi:hypothetical protein